MRLCGFEDRLCRKGFFFFSHITAVGGDVHADGHHPASLSVNLHRFSGEHQKGESWILSEISLYMAFQRTRLVF